MNAKACIAIIGGSGLYELDNLTDIEEHSVDTPFGHPSDVIVGGKLGDAYLLFLPRHGRKHHLLPSEVNYRANIYALKALGAEWCISIGAVGSLKEEFAPGDFVIPDQVIDFTKRRESSFFGGGIVAHPSIADPFCPVLRKALNQTCAEVGARVGFTSHLDGTYLCMEGPALSSRAESHFYRSFGCHIIGMTLQPEAKLAREAELGAASVCMITDYDCWRQETSDASVTDILRLLKKTTQNAKQLISPLAEALCKLSPSEMAAQALDTALVTDLTQAPADKLEQLEVILRDYQKRNG